MIVRILKTDNENQRGFELKNPVSVREKTYASSAEAGTSPVASKIFGFPWAESVTVAPRLVTVFKQEWVSWDVLEEPLKDLLNEHFSGFHGDIEENPESGKKEDVSNVPNHGETDGLMTKASHLDSPEAQTIKNLIDNEINPALASHGGFVTLHSVEGEKVFIEMGGGCQGCAMSYKTLKEGIEEAIKQAVPGVTEVIDTTDHDEGETPYYTDPV